MTDIPTIRVMKLDPEAKIPTQGSEEAGGLDLRIMESVTIPAGQRATLKTGIALAVPTGMVGLIWPRSKLANHYGVSVLAGVIDADYRGEIMVSLLNTGLDPVELRKFDKCAQLIIQPSYSWLPLDIVTTFEETKRGTSGIMSTDMRMQ